MKLLILSFCALFKLSTSILFEERPAEVLEPLYPNKVLFQSFHENQSIKVNKNVNKFKSIAADDQEYIFLSDLEGKVIIIGTENYGIVISYSLPEISKSISAIVNDTFYNIDTLNGEIFSTDVGNLLKGPSSINWTLVGAFPKEVIHIRCSSAVNGSDIYFVTHSGILYLYDSISKITFKVGQVGLGDNHASLIVLGDVLYIFAHDKFFSYNGASISSLTTSATRIHSGLFQQEKNVCLVGGNQTNLSPDPVYCYNPSSKQWSTPNHITDCRQYPGVVTVGARTYVFGGQAYFYNNFFPSFWRDSVEVFDHETNRWGFIPSPLTEGQEFIQALAIKF